MPEIVKCFHLKGLDFNGWTRQTEKLSGALWIDLFIEFRTFNPSFRPLFVYNVIENSNFCNNIVNNFVIRIVMKWNINIFNVGPKKFVDTEKNLKNYPHGCTSVGLV